MSSISVELEPWSDCWEEMKALTELHSNEVDAGVEPRRKFEVDTDIVRQMELAGMFKVLVARSVGQMIGYFTWTLAPDVESRGLLIGLQGAWYVLPGFPRAAFLLFDESVRVLRSLGVKHIFPHHRTQGRGAGLGKFFRRRGAKHIQDTYSLWIGD